MAKEKEIWFEILASNKYEWLRSARNLHTGSLILYEESAKGLKKLNEYLEKAGSADDEWFPEAGTFLAARMLAGLSLENLVKALIVRKFPDKVSKGKFDLDHHDTVSLIKEYLPEVNLSKEDRVLMTELVKSVVWKGKYPTPLKANEIEDPKIIKAEIKRFESIYHDLRTWLQSK
jgi:hypothetical protein